MPHNYEWTTKVATTGSTWTHALLTGSPAVDHILQGINGCGTTVDTDQRGVSRPQNTSCDIGAFEARSFILDVSLAGTGDGSVSGTGISCGVDCTESYLENTVVTLTATADTGSIFSAWPGGLGGSTNPVTLTITADTAVTATFALEQYELSVLLAGTGSGSVTSNPAGIDCGSSGGSDCTETLDYGTVVTLTATADAGSIFTGWSGACSRAIARINERS